jgi:UDP-N-acetylmuramoylalanine--D-glutamate ligase
MNVFIKEISSQKSPNQLNPFVVVLGAGESGVGAAILARQKGFPVFVSDMGLIKDIYKRELVENNIDFEESGHNENFILEKARLVIKSPGIPDKAPLVKALKEKGIEIIDEIEFASRFSKAKIIAVTGSNGKTTTTRLIYHILETAGFDVGLAGNVGFSLAKQVAERDRAYYAVEISSFQLDGCNKFRPYIGILTNITPDHLDRYEYKLNNYIASKFRIAQNKLAEDVFIYNAEDENIAFGFGHFWNQHDKEGCVAVSMSALANDSAYLNVEHSDFSINKSDLTIQGWHNRFNISCAVLAAKKLGVDNEKITQALRTFVNEAHRLESVCTINGVEYINDSKATNVDSVFYALEAMTKPVVWIVGGVDKGNDYSPLFELVEKKVKAVICMGKDNEKILNAFKNKIEIIVESGSMQEALKAASLYANNGDVVLLSPACASFDLFNNYQHRGNVFKEILSSALAELEKK